MRLPLTDMQSKVYDFIKKYVEERDYPPLIREIQEKLEVQNPATVHKCIKALESKGWLRREKGKHRGIFINGEGLK